MRVFSKSKLMALRQCPKRLWLEVHRPDLREDSASAQARFDTGHVVGRIARQVYDPTGSGVTVDVSAHGHQAALQHSRELLATARGPVFEAGFSVPGAIGYADVMLPVRKRGRTAWRMVEVKSSTKVKDYHHDDIAIQSFLARNAGVDLEGVAVATLDNAFVYPGDEQYEGLFKESDLTTEAFARDGEVKGWVREAGEVAATATEPDIRTGAHCNEPYECGFLGHCSAQEPQAVHPITWLPRVGKKVKEFASANGLIEMRDVPDTLLNDEQQRVKVHTLSGSTFFDAKGARADLSARRLPVYFLDFETAQFAVPVWPGFRPYEQAPFQFSVHRIGADESVSHAAFVDTLPGDPSGRLAPALLDACGSTGTVFAYNASFEKGRIRELARRLPALSGRLLALEARLVDLLPIAQKRLYHPSQQGSWSIKSVLPVIAPELDYSKLDGVQEGQGAMQAYFEAAAPGTSPERRAQLERQLLEYCKLDTLALVRLWRVLAGRDPLPA